MDNSKVNNEQAITDWEYCYCCNCRRIRARDELIATPDGARCARCGETDLEGPGWVDCPHQKGSAVKCPRSGKGIINVGGQPECLDRCHFRDMKQP